MVLFSEAMFPTVNKIPFINRLSLHKFAFALVHSFLKVTNILFHPRIVLHIKVPSLFATSEGSLIDNRIRFKYYLDSASVFLSIHELPIVNLILVKAQQPLILLIRVDGMPEVDTILEFLDQWALYCSFRQLQ